MTAYQYFLYSKGDTEGGKKATIIAVSVAVAFSLLSEIGQGMERDNIRMESKSQESPTYKAIVQAIGAGAGASYNPYSADLQAAEMKLAQCEERLARGKEKHCEGSKARVDAVNKMIAGADQSSQAKALALATTAKTMERDENNYHPLVKFIREVFGASGTAASFLLSLTLISFFEYAFHYLGGQFAASREYLMAHGYDVTRKLRQPPRKHDGSVTTYSNEANESAPVSSFNSNANSARQTVGEFAAKVEQGLKSSPEIIANEYARAQNARENVYTVAANKLDGIQTVLNQASELKNPAPVKTWRESLNAGEKIVSTGGLDEPVINARPANQMSVEATVKQIQASVKASGANSPTAIQAAVFDAYAGMANPAPLNDVILERMAEKLASKATIPTTVPAAPFHQKSGATGIHNPVLGTAEEHFSIPLPHAPHAHVGAENMHVQQPMLHAPHAHVGAENMHVQQPMLHAPHAHVGGLEVGSIESYEAADSAKVGSMVGCPQCGAEFKKRNAQHKFCCAKHRDAWHNDRDQKRQEFIASRKSKTA